jgi:hypothetical protein
VEVGTAKVGPHAAGANVSQRVGLAVTVKVNRHAKVLPDALAKLPRKLVGGGEGGAAERNDRKYVRRSDPRVYTSMFAEVDVIDRDLHGCEKRA